MTMEQMFSSDVVITSSFTQLEFAYYRANQFNGKKSVSLTGLP